MSLTAIERRIVLLVGAVQFVNILDFMMVMPLGPDFARALGIPASQIGLIGGSYTAAACLAGLAGALFLDRFDRRRALAVALAGLILATALGGLAWDLQSLIAARVLAGVFGGPASALAVAIVADSVAPERRGRAMGAVGGAFAAASVLGVPFGLKLAEIFDWRAPFFAVAALGLAIAAAVIVVLPPQRGHLALRAPQGVAATLRQLGGLLRRRNAQYAYLLMAAVMFAGFAIIPNISAYVQFNLGFPRNEIEWLYLLGGLISFFGMRFAGRMVDRLGGFRVSIVATLAVAALVWVAFVRYDPAISLYILFPLFMLTNSARMVVTQTTISKVPQPWERAGFMSLMSAVQHAASAGGAILSSFILVAEPSGALIGIDRVAMLSILIGFAVPPLVGLIERRLAAAARPAQPDPVVRGEAAVEPPAE
ncbi:MAG TPA: MFS transporter [Alphaproteobacteria bacterium]|nr:MFS transporter [Alphaproteobacteria bacterium]